MGIFSNDIKIKSDLSNNFFNIYNEARGIAMNRKRILGRKKNIPIHYMNLVFFVFVIIFILSLIMLIQHYSIYFVRYALFIIIMDILFYLFLLLRGFISYCYRRRDKFISSIIINKKGITDLSSFKNVEILFKWDRVKGIVIGVESVVVFIDKNIYFYFDIDDKKKIIDSVKKFKKDILVIE